MTWVFILLFHAATFGGDFRLEFQTQTQDGCERLQKVVLKEIEKQLPYLKFEVQDCREVVPHAG